MKYLPLIVRNVARNKVRSILTALSIAASVFLVVTLYSFLTHQDELTDASKIHNRVAVLNEAGLAGRIPIAYVDRIRNMPGVEVAAPMSWFGGTYREEMTTFPQFGTDADIFEVYPEFELPPEQLEAWKDDRSGCIVGAVIARNKNWKVGDKIPLGRNLYPIDLQLTVRGIYDGQSTVDKEWLLFHFAYMDEALREQREPTSGNAGLVMLRTDSAQRIPEVMQALETSYASSDAPVKTMTEKEFAQSFTEMIGNVRGFIGYTSAAVVAALLCVGANTMAMSLRERTREIALLKAIGFPRTSVLGMFLSESILLGLLGGVVGALGAKVLFDAVDMSKAMPGFGLFYVPWTTALAGAALAAVVGLLSGIVPAWRAANLVVIDGLRKVV